MNLVSAIRASGVTSYQVNPVGVIGSGIPLEHLAKQDLATMMDQRTHPAVRMYDLVENGELKKALIKDMETPPVTCVGKLADSIFNTIAYFYDKLKTTEKTKQTTRGLFESLEERQTTGCKALSPSEIGCVSIPVGLKATRYGKGNCTYNNPVNYESHFIFSDSNNNDASSLPSCINEFMNQCKTDCFFCWDDLFEEKRTGSYSFTYQFQSEHYPGRKWEVFVVAPENIYGHTRMLMQSYSDIIVSECESSQKKSENKLINNLVIGCLIPIGGLVWVGMLAGSAWAAVQRDRAVLVADDPQSETESTEESILIPDPNEPTMEEDSTTLLQK
jgi:hypothetical protein